MEHDLLARALSAMKNAENRGKATVELKPSSKLIQHTLAVLKKEKYIEDFKFIDDGRGGIIVVNLKGVINNIGVVKPRYSVKIDEYEKFEERYLPAKDFGRLILSTPKGVITHLDAKNQKTGGVLLAFVYWWYSLK